MKTLMVCAIILYTTAGTNVAIVPTDPADENVYGWVREMPQYLIMACNLYNIPWRLAYNWSFAESSHNPKKVSHKEAYGRYQIKKVWLDDVCRLRKIKFPKNWQAYLLDDKNNCIIWAWSVNFWRRRGHSDKDIAQIWLFGLTGFREGGYSARYEDVIFNY